MIATGIPISAKFSAKIDPKAVRQAVGLRDDQPVLLVLSGGFGMSPVAEILAELDKVPYALVLGQKEAEAQSVSVRSRARGDEGVQPFASFLERLQTEIATRALPAKKT